MKYEKGKGSIVEMAKSNAELTMRKLKELATTTPLTIEGVKKLTDGRRNKHIS